MKKKIVPVARERMMREEDFIVSKTDTKGRITYANRVFMAFAGYDEKELLGMQHNVIRHPDMPRGVFKLMWETLHAGHEFFGYVKNLASDGSYYWTFANVTPTRGPRGETIGYFSVRRKPSADALARIEPLYTAMRRREDEAGPRDAVTASRRMLDEFWQPGHESYDHFVLSI